MSGYHNAGDGSDAESFRAIHRALDLGVTLLDTAGIVDEVVAIASGAGATPAQIDGRQPEVVL